MRNPISFHSKKAKTLLQNEIFFDRSFFLSPFFCRHCHRLETWIGNSQKSLERIDAIYQKEVHPWTFVFLYGKKSKAVAWNAEKPSYLLTNPESSYFGNSTLGIGAWRACFPGPWRRIRRWLQGWARARRKVESRRQAFFGVFEKDFFWKLLLANKWKSRADFLFLVVVLMCVVCWGCNRQDGCWCNWKRPTVEEEDGRETRKKRRKD